MTSDRPDERGHRRMRDEDRTEGDARRRRAGARGAGEPPEWANDGPPERADGDPPERADDRPPEWVDGGPPATGIEVEEPDASRVAAALGQVGVYLGVAAVGFAVLGIALGVAGAGLFTRVALVLALGLGALSMVLAAVFQASAGGLLRGD